jgi:hypothetical protein
VRRQDLNPVGSGTVSPSSKDWLLLFLSSDSLRADGPGELEPVRVQKGMFLLSQRGPAPRVYDFVPYNWGPFSKQIYADLEDLEEAGLVRIKRPPERPRRVYALTPLGELAAQRIAAQVSQEDVRWLAHARTYVTSRTFTQLLREIYAEFPAFATNSHLNIT